MYIVTGLNSQYSYFSKCKLRKYTHKYVPIEIKNCYWFNYDNINNNVYFQYVHASITFSGKLCAFNKKCALINHGMSLLGPSNSISVIMKDKSSVYGFYYPCLYL